MNVARGLISQAFDSIDKWIRYVKEELVLGMCEIAAGY